MVRGIADIAKPWRDYGPPQTLAIAERYPHEPDNLDLPRVNPQYREHRVSDQDAREIAQMLSAFVLADLFKLLALPDFYSPTGESEDAWDALCAVRGCRNGKALAVADSTLAYIEEHPLCTWTEIYYGIEHHYRSADSLSGSMRYLGIYASRNESLN